MERAKGHARVRSQIKDRRIRESESVPKTEEEFLNKLVERWGFDYDFAVVDKRDELRKDLTEFGNQRFAEGVEQMRDACIEETGNKNIIHVIGENLIRRIAEELLLNSKSNLK
jgi:hypothetical protein